jgi:hypothetical protein
MRPTGAAQAGAVPRHKGTGLLPVVKALKLAPSGPSAVPASLQYYLDDYYVVTSEWYPEEDYNVLIQILADIVQKSGRVSDVWEYFGKAAAQRDLMGQQTLVPRSSRIPNAGAYRNFIGNETTSAYSMFVRLTKLWSMYHDTGKMTAARSGSDARLVHVRVSDFKFPSRGLVELQMAYFCEYARLTGNSVTGRIVSASSEGAPVTEWAYVCANTKDVVDSIAQLPLLA